MKNKSIKSLKSLCVRAKFDNVKLRFYRTHDDKYYVVLKDFGYTRSYKDRDYIFAALKKACAKYGVEFVY